MRAKRISVAVVAACAGAGLAAVPAYAAHPGENGEIAFVQTDVVGSGLSIQLKTLDMTTGAQRVLSVGVGAPNEDGDPEISGTLLTSPEFTADGKRLITNYLSSVDPIPQSSGLVTLLPLGKKLRIIDAQSGATQCDYTSSAAFLSRHQFDPSTGQILVSKLDDSASPAQAPFSDGVGERVDTNCVGGQGGFGAGGALHAFFGQSPDGQYLVDGVDSGSGPPTVAEVHKLGAAPTAFSTGIFLHPDFSPDGTEVAYGSGDGDGGAPAIKVMNVRTGAVRTVADGFEDGTIMQPVFSPDGKKILFARTTFEDSNFISELRMVDANSTGGLGTAVLGATPLRIVTMPDWGPTPPAPTPPVQTPAASAANPVVPGAPGAGSPVCNAVDERPKTATAGAPKFNKSQLANSQRRAVVARARLNAVYDLLEERQIDARYFCAGSLGPSAFQAGIPWIGGGAHQPIAPNAPGLDPNVPPRRPAAFRATRQQAVNNERVSIGLFNLAVALTKKFDGNLTGAYLAPGTKLGGRALWPGLTPGGALPAPVQPVAEDLEVAKIRLGKVTATPAQIRKTDRRTSRAIILANRLIDQIEEGLTDANFRPGSIGQEYV